MKQAILKDALQNQIQFFQFLSPKLAKQLLDQETPKKGINHAEGEEEEDEEEDEDEEDEDDDLDPEILEEKALLQSMTPFTVISQEEGIDLQDEKGNRIQGREFPWGTLNCLDSKHCDLGGLRSALLLSHRSELKEITYGFFYEKYRTERLMARTKSQHIQHLKDQTKSGSTTPSGLKNKESMLSISSGTPIAGPWEE